MRGGIEGTGGLDGYMVVITGVNFPVRVNGYGGGGGGGGDVQGWSSRRNGGGVKTEDPRSWDNSNG